MLAPLTLIVQKIFGAQYDAEKARYERGTGEDPEEGPFSLTTSACMGVVSLHGGDPKQVAKDGRVCWCWCKVGLIA